MIRSDDAAHPQHSQARGQVPNRLLLGGLLLGIVVGFYELAKIVWRH